MLYNIEKTTKGDGAMRIIAHIRTDFQEKFGIPRQSGLVKTLLGRIIFEPEYRNPQAVRGLEEFTYIWLLWKFSESKKGNWAATVKPPRLGGNQRMGVFATRSPYRPNDIGLSSVKLEQIVYDDALGPVLLVSGIDILDNTPIYDIKPYLPYTDSHPEAKAGFAEEVFDYALEVEFPETLLVRLPLEKRMAVIEVLKQDPRPAYQKDEHRKYGVFFAGYDIRFYVKGHILKVCEVVDKRTGKI